MIKGNFHYMLPSKNLRALDLFISNFQKFNSDHLLVFFWARSSIPPILLLPRSPFSYCRWLWRRLVVGRGRFLTGEGKGKTNTELKKTSSKKILKDLF